MKRLQKIHADLWGSYIPVFILSKYYIGLLFNEFICKL